MRDVYKRQEKNRRIVRDLLDELVLDESFSQTEPQGFAGKTFVITGSLAHYENRDALKAVIESRGGKAAGSVSKKTDYLINNDNESSSSKNKKAKELGIPIITEEQFIKLLDEADKSSGTKSEKEITNA